MRGLFALAAWVLCASASLASAHPLAPASLSLAEGDAGRVEMTLRAIPEAYPRLSVEVPAGCQQRGPVREHAAADAVVAERTLQCSALPAPDALQLRGLSAAGIDAVVRVQAADGSVRHTLRSPGTPLLASAQVEDGGGVFARYLQLGFEHLWGGADHVLFVLCLLMMAPSVRAAVWALSAFTLGHALTLTLSALDLVHLPQASAEISIAASLVWMAGSVLLEGRSGRHLVPAGVGFGLVHGLGFAGVLREVGLPAGEIPLSLLAFNLGIEVGQLSLALLVWLLVALLRLRADGRRLDLASAYGIACLTGVLGAFWVFERL